MKMKQLATALLAIVLALSPVIGALGFVNFKVNAVGTEDELDVRKYFYNQLKTDESKAFYDAMETMLKDGSFIAGESVDLIANHTFDEATAKAYGSALMNDFGAARDAFYFDHPSVFYVDFSALSLRATTDEKGGYHLYLGTGRYDTYYTEGFETEADVRAAIAEYDAALDAFVKDVKANCGRDVKKETLAHAEVEYAHDKLADLVTYTLEKDCPADISGFIRTAYGALVTNKGVCEAYTRAFKAVMDELGIPCVMVQGVYRHNDEKHGSTEGVDELHIWNYVYLYDPKAIVEKVGEAVQGDTVVEKTELKEIAEDTTGGWYGVDVTMDDPVYSNGQNKPTTEYLLAGSSLMSRNHIPDGVLSEANYPFTYPGLSLEGYGVTYTEYKGTDGDKDVILKIGYNPYSLSDGDTIAGQYLISINVDGVDMGIEAANKAGYHLLMRNGEQEENGTDKDGLYIVKDTLNPDGSVKMSGWYYVFLGYGFEDYEDYCDLRFAQLSWIDYAVTKTPMDFETYKDSYFHGADDDIISMTEKPLHNVNGDYKAPPYPDLKQSAPSMQGNLDIDGSTYTIKTVWDDELMLATGVKKPTIEVYAEHWLGDARVHNSSAEKNCKIGEVEWDGHKTTTFTFKPSDMFMDDGVVYTFYIKGLIGKTSGKLPIELTYVASHPCAICRYKSQGIDWNGFGKPFLMENDDLSTKGWKDENGEDVGDNLRQRLALVVSPTNAEQEEQMKEALRNNAATKNDQIVQSQTYNISLNACKKNVPKTGQSLRVSLGFPDGYGPNDAGVTFKAYHFITDSEGKVTGVEEIPCIVTEYGLVLLVDSFSPFEIAVVESDGSVAATRSILAVPSTNGGTITGEALGEGGVAELKKDETVTLTVEAKEGYVIDSISVAGKEIAVLAETTKQEITVSYEELTNPNVTAVVEASFIASTVQEREIESGELAVGLTQKKEAVISLAPEITVNEGEKATITATVTVEDGEYTCQWYRVDSDGNEEEIEGQTGLTLVIESAAADDAGTYRLKVTFDGTVFAKDTVVAVTKTPVPEDTDDKGTESDDSTSVTDESSKAPEETTKAPETTKEPDTTKEPETTQTPELTAPVLEDSEDGVTASVPNASEASYYEGAKLTVEKKTESKSADEQFADKYEKYQSYKIELTKNGSDISVKSTLTVSIPVPQGWNAGTTKVYHISDNGTVTDMMASATADGKYVTFTTTHFSEFVLVDTSSVISPVSSAPATESTAPAATTESKAPETTVSAETQAPSPAEPPKTGSDAQTLVLAVLVVVSMTSIGFIAMDVKKQNKRK